MDAPQGVYAGSVIGKSDTAFWDAFSPRVYVKGALVLHMLRAVVGDSTFFTIMRDYLNDRRLRYSSARTEDFVAACENAYGKSLKWFFDEWVYNSLDSIDRPGYEYHWHVTRDGSRDSVAVYLRQTTADQFIFRMPMTLTLVDGTSEQSFSIIDSLAEQTFLLVTETVPTDVLVDKDHAVFKVLTAREEH